MLNLTHEPWAQRAAAQRRAASAGRAGRSSLETPTGRHATLSCVECVDCARGLTDPRGCASRVCRGQTKARSPLRETESGAGRSAVDDTWRDDLLLCREESGGRETSEKMENK